MGSIWSDAGLKAGLEIHQQLDTAKKLFCGCRSGLSKDKPTRSVARRLRPVAGESGEIDIAASYEILKNKQFEYEVYQQESCEVELDEELPHQMNTEALSIALQIAVMLNCGIPDEIQVMRKTVVDGSNTSGFQRTAVIGLDGFIETSFGKVRIASVAVEEDSGQIVSKDQQKAVYGLDRLGIPLVEISTQADIRTPEQVREVAEKLGYIIRSTGSVKRGLGTIRQDVNVSVIGGQRVEIKGAQDLRTLPKLVEVEAERQLKLINIHQMVKGLNASGLEATDITGILKNTKSKLVSAITSSGGGVVGARLIGMGGLLGQEIQPNKRFGTELSEYAKVAGAKGLIHSDEDLKGKYGFSEEEIKEVKTALKCGEKDAFVLVGDKLEVANRAVLAAVARANMQQSLAVQKEVRKAEEDSTTTFLRPMSGAARLYPETDLPPMRVGKSLVEYIKANPPELWEDKIERFVKEYKVNKDTAAQLVKSDKAGLFEEIAKMGFEPNMVFRALIPMLAELKAEGLDAEKLTHEIILEIFKKSNKTISKEALYGALKAAAKTGKAEGVEAGLSGNELRKIVKDTISKNKDVLGKHNAEQILMGEVMKAVRGRVAGKVVLDIIREELKGK